MAWNFQGPSTPGFTSNPFNPNNVGDEFGNPWGVWNPAADRPARQSQDGRARRRDRR